MRRLVTTLCCIAVGAGVAACGSGSTPVSQRPGPSGATTITRAVDKNIQLVNQTQTVLFNLYSDTHDLATHALPTGETLIDLRNLSTQASHISIAAGLQLPATDPARPLIVRSAKSAAAAAATLRTVSLDAATQGQLLAVTDPLTRLNNDIGEVARHVTGLETTNIAQDLSHLHQTLAALPRV